jgi:hypothetical protein
MQALMLSGRCIGETSLIGRITISSPGDVAVKLEAITNEQ